MTLTNSTRQLLRAPITSAQVRLRRMRKPKLAARYDERRQQIPGVELLSDGDLERLNELLPWHCFTVDSKGRPFGSPAWAGKRTEPEIIPDRRIGLFADRFQVADKHVLEVGCFEGVHTIALCDVAREVTAVDARVENVVKTIVRSAFFRRYPRVLTVDLERRDVPPDLLAADVCHHVGVLYHLTDPVRHLLDLGRWVSRGIMLDTHYATPEQVDDEYEVDGERYRVLSYPESGRPDPFSGMHLHAKWLLREDIERVLRAAGFDTIEIVENRSERNGERVLLFAERTA